MATSRYLWQFSVSHDLQGVLVEKLSGMKFKEFVPSSTPEAMPGMKRQTTLLMKGDVLQMNYDELEKLALACGFSHVGRLDADTIKVREEVRKLCAQDKCHAYGKSWSCPPACGTLSECEAIIRKYKKGLILQTTSNLESSFDFEGMKCLDKAHKKAVEKFTRKIKETIPNALVLGAGTCTVCKTCTYPDEPCRFPEKMVSSMEAFGMIVTEVCKANGIQYYYGEGTLTYVACALVE